MNTRGPDGRKGRQAQRTGTVEDSGGEPSAVGGGDAADQGGKAEPPHAVSEAPAARIDSPPDHAAEAADNTAATANQGAPDQGVPDRGADTDPQQAADKETAAAQALPGEAAADMPDAQAQEPDAAESGADQTGEQSGEEAGAGASDEPAADEANSAGAAGQDAAAGPAEASEAPPSREISRLDHLLAHITGKAASAVAPSNDNLSEAGTPPASSESGTAEGGNGAAAGPEPTGAEETGGDAAEPASSGAAPQPAADAAPERTAAQDDMAATLAAEISAAGVTGSGAASQEVEPGEDDGAEWPNGWGPPSGQNVLRVLGNLMSELDSQASSRAENDGTENGDAAPQPGAEAGAEDSAGAAPGTQAGAGRRKPAPRRAISRAAVPPSGEPAQVPSRPILTSPTVRAEAEHWRWVHEAAPKDQPQAPPTGTSANATVAGLPEAGQTGANAAVAASQPGAGEQGPATPPTAKAQEAAPQPSQPAQPGQAAVHGLSPWMVEQPEFRRAFGATVEIPVEEAAPAEVVEQAELAVASGWRWTRMLVTGVTMVAVFAVAGYGLYAIQFADEAPPSTPGTSSASAPTATQGEAEGDAGAESLLPAPVLPPDADTARAVRSNTTDISPAGENEFSTFSRPVGGQAAQPRISIERTAVRPFADGSAGALAVSRFDALNVSAAKLIAAYDVDKAKNIVDDILTRDPAHVGALLNRGRIALMQNRFEDAEADFQQVRQIRPQSLAAALGQSEALLGQRRASEALKIITASIATNPGEVAAYDLRARAHAQTGAVDQISADCAELSWKLGYSYVGKWCEAMAYKDAGRTDDAEAAFRSAMKSASEEFIRHRQRYLKFRGHYEGEVDGQTGPATNRALAACAADPNC